MPSGLHLPVVFGSKNFASSFSSMGKEEKVGMEHFVCLAYKLFCKASRAGIIIPILQMWTLSCKDVGIYSGYTAGQ